MTQRSVNDWNPSLYNEKIGFVSRLGKNVVDLLNPQKGERILDIGCGTGDLTHEIEKRGAVPMGIDLASSMIEKARQKYPHIQFRVENAETFRTTEPYDAVFSNAALHWMKQTSAVVELIWLALRPGGRFVAEFGGKDNVAAIIQGIVHVLDEFGVVGADRNPWYFPSIGEYSAVLEKQGFRVTYMEHFDRPTPLGNGEDGLEHWLHAFADDFFQGLSEQLRSIAIEEIKQRLKSALYINDTWIADYKRLRVIAVKS